MITIKTKQLLKNFSGEPLKNGETEMTIGDSIAIILGSSNTSSNSTLCWILGNKMSRDTKVELKAEEVVFLKKEIEGSKSFSAIITGQLMDILENEKSDAKTK